MILNLGFPRWLINRDPLLQVNDNFVELLAEGRKQRDEQLNLKKQAVENDVDVVSMRNSTLNDLDLSEMRGGLAAVEATASGGGSGHCEERKRETKGESVCLLVCNQRNHELWWFVVVIKGRPEVIGVGSRRYRAAIVCLKMVMYAKGDDDAKEGRIRV
ncbi:hypothetical protein L1987_20397 [Smallanthus sonchifolius]|uniref:Uncharacterized protein n=1 Tax=Smallanthus sonchifolius TaxID=185202 RepID=A0ACB9ITF6_9ASTR|nr:hypothetical protein L1987_20397 [Smallanthus sonchifolius]